jgi:hypothetical protein
VDKDGECHISDYILKGKKKKTLKNKKVEQIAQDMKTHIEPIEVKTVDGLSEDILKAISKAKKNIFVSKNWNKRADNKILKLYKDEGEALTLHILKILYSNLKTDISKTLVAYISGILKNIKGDKGLLEEIKTPKKKVSPKKQPDTHTDVEDAVIVPPKNGKKSKKQVDEKLAIVGPIEKILLELYEKMEEKEKEGLLVKAKEMFKLDTKISKFTKIHEKIFKSVEKIYLLKILKKEKGL